MVLSAVRKVNCHSLKTRILKSPLVLLIADSSRERYILSPYTLTWNGDFYYVVGWSDKHEKIATFRVDRMADTPVLLEVTAVKKPKGYSIGTFAEKAFRMYDADHGTVTLLCDNCAMNTVIDHFGTEAKTKPVDKDHFQLEAEVSVSPTFFS